MIKQIRTRQASYGHSILTLIIFRSCCYPPEKTGALLQRYFEYIGSSNPERARTHVDKYPKLKLIIELTKWKMGISICIYVCIYVESNFGLFRSPTLQYQSTGNVRCGAKHFWLVSSKEFLKDLTKTICLTSCVFPGFLEVMDHEQKDEFIKQKSIDLAVDHGRY